MDRQLTLRIGEFVRIADASYEPVIRDIIPSYGSILVIYDHHVMCRSYVAERLLEWWSAAGELRNDSGQSTVDIAVIYGDAFGEDLAEVAAVNGLSVEEVITLHASVTYTVGAVGFSPGFTYLIGMPPELTTPRRATPRLRVPAGSIGIGGDQTGVYALPSAGGWNLIGRSPERLFDSMAPDAFRLRLGDQVRFVPVTTSDGFSDVKTDVARGAACVEGVVEVLSPGMQTTVQDLGRWGFGRFGFAVNGAADRTSLISANRAVGNPDGAAGLEFTFSGPELRFHRRMSVSVTGPGFSPSLNGRRIKPGRLMQVVPGDELRWDISRLPDGMRGYIALQGGVDVPEVLGSASTDLTAGIGGYRGRALRAGDRLQVGNGPRLRAGLARQAVQYKGVFEVVPGPQRHRFEDASWQTLLDTLFTVSADVSRVGVRLDGPPILPTDGADILSEGIVTGSIQVTGEGKLIVMLPGHATIGGYTKIGTVVETDWDRLGQLRPGDTVRFTCRCKTN